MNSPAFELVLASGSPRRRDLLAGAGIQPRIRPADIDETPLPGEAPSIYVERLAREKAEAFAHPGEVVLAADTTVTVDGEILGKPDDLDHARTMLQSLSGRTHHTMTGVAIHQTDDGRTESVVAVTEVTFVELTDADLDWYLTSDECLDKAGAYAIQGSAACLVESISGSVSNVVGLPLAETMNLAHRLGLDLRGLAPIRD
ncbi:MAG: septum formation inhibitor Maf [Actinomycetia bacterium]|nr:septum formation inhibitor Maf [Actinomycetes bacterium]